MKSKLKSSRDEIDNLPLTGKEFFAGLTKNVIEYLKNPKEEHGASSFLESISKQVVGNLLQDGHVIIDDLRNNPDLVRRKAIQTLLVTPIKGIVTTYTDKILAQAENYRENNNEKFAYIFYAMFFEHSINKVIKAGCEKKRLDKKTINEIIKTTNINSKFTWVLTLLNAKPFSTKHLRTINFVAENRNAIIHYKWDRSILSDDKPIPTPRQKQAELVQTFKSIKQAVRYIKQYDSAMFHPKAKGALNKVLKKTG